MVKCNCGKRAYYRDEEGKMYCGKCKVGECKDIRHCEHGKRKEYCSICGGGGLCEHGKQKYFCSECGGSGICEHGKEKRYCQDCGGSGICEHGKIRRYCQDCGGSGICEHGKIKYYCPECGGSALCEHGKQKYYCQDCGGNAFCEHGREKRYCPECGGGGICEHRAIRKICLICTPSYGCQNCFSVGVQKHKWFHPYCFRCYCVLNPDADIPRKFKIKEMHVRDALKALYPDIFMVFDKRVEGPCSSGKRPDVLIDNGFPIIIECDEEQHANYSCENKRTMELFLDLGSRPLRMIRFNPDKYTDESGKKYKSCFKNNNKTGGLSLNKSEWERRIAELKRVIDEMLPIAPEKEVDVIHLFY